MIQLRKSRERGYFDHGWLKTYHTFSFAEYRDPAHVHFRALRVMNEDVVAPGQGFGTHPHEDMEIVTYVLSGALEHKDSMGNGEVLRPGEFQRMSAGTGILHSEFNPSGDEPVHLYQIWLFPERRGITPSYEQRKIAGLEPGAGLRLVASPEEQDEALFINQNARIYLAKLRPDEHVQHELSTGRHAWLQTLRGEVTLRSDSGERYRLVAGDGAAISQESNVHVSAGGDAEIMLFDLA